MTRRRLQHASLFAGLIGLFFVGGYGLWLFQSQRHQYSLDRKLISALVKNDIPQMIVLVNEGADPNTPYIAPPVPSLRKMGDYLLHRSSLPVKDSLTAFQIECGAYDDSILPPSYTRSDVPELVQTMIVHGAHCNTADMHGSKPLGLAAMMNRPKTVGVLLDSGVDINTRDTNGRTPLYVATNHASDTLEVLLLRGADVNAKDNGGDTPLHWAIAHSQSYLDEEITDIVRQLLAHGANPNLPNKQGITPIQLAQQNDRPDLVALLWQVGAPK